MSAFRPLFVEVDVEAVRVVTAEIDADLAAADRLRLEVEVMKAAGPAAFSHYLLAVSHGLGHRLAFREALSIG